MEEFIDFDNKSELAFTPEGKLLISMLNQAIEDALYVSPNIKEALQKAVVEVWQVKII